MKYKYKFGNGFAFYEKKDLKMFEEMAEKGYEPIGANLFGFYKFTSIAPETVEYTMDITNFNQNCDDFADYQDIFTSGGWLHVFSLNNVHFFKAPKGTKAVYTDFQSESQKYHILTSDSFKFAITAITLSLFMFVIVHFLTLSKEIKMVLFLLASMLIGVGVVMVLGTILNWTKVRKLK